MNSNDKSLDTIVMKKDLINDKTVVENLLKMFKYITELKILLDSRLLSYSLIEVIINNCIHLLTLHMRGSFEGFDSIEYKVRHEFSQRLTSIDIDLIGAQQMKRFLTLTQNLKIIHLRNDLKVIINPFLLNLKEVLDLNVLDLYDFKAFTDAYRDQIKKISLHFNNNSINALLIELSKFQILEKMDINFGISDSFIDNELILIGNECKQLKKLAISGFNFKLEKKLFEVFSGFYALKKLSISGKCIDIKSIGNIMFLGSCHNLLFLELYLRNYNISDEDLNGIDLYLPQLKHLSLISIDCYYGITDESVQQLSKLQNLIQLHVSSGQMTSSGVKDFIENSPNIKKLELCDKYINDITIEAFIKRANLKPKISFKFFSFNCDQTNKTEDVPNLKVYN
jgi:hypothetical protein